MTPNRMLKVTVIALASLLLLAPCASNAARAKARDNNYMVSAANPHAARAGQTILAAGGSAVDAAIAVQMVLTLVEPQSSGIGGGAFMLHFQQSSGDLVAYDGRETAPATATPDLFLDAGGKPQGFMDAVVSGKSVGVPGVLRMLELAHRDYGQLPWRDLFQPAIALATNGFKISPRLHFLIDRDKMLAKEPTTRAYFYGNDGKPLPVGALRRNQAYADVLSRIADRKDGDYFYKGAAANKIVEAVNSHRKPGGLSMSDMAAYQAKKRPVLCQPYRAWKICGMPPPTSGGIALLQIMGMLSHFPATDLTPGTVTAVHLMSEATRLAFADRDHYVADSDFVDVPISGLLDAEYLARRAALIAPDQRIEDPKPGQPERDDALNDLAIPAPDQSLELPSTSHFSIVDSNGNVLSMTTSIETAFGSHIMVDGFLLNNQLTDFSLVPEIDGKPVANRVEAGKRPRSSMTPTLVFDGEGRPVMAIGSPGGPLIISFVAKTVSAVLDGGLGISDAVALPHHIAMGDYLVLEARTPLVKLAPSLWLLGHKAAPRSLNSGLHAITITYDEQGEARLDGAADHRREGVVLTGSREGVVLSGRREGVALSDGTTGDHQPE